jgi:hypothetical protein
MNHKDLQTVLEDLTLAAKMWDTSALDDAIAIVKAELDKPDEPVAWIVFKKDMLTRDVVSIGARCPALWVDEAVPLYTSPQSCEGCKPTFTTERTAVVQQAAERMP